MNSGEVTMDVRLLQVVPGTGGRHKGAEWSDSGVSKAEPQDLPIDLGM